MPTVKWLKETNGHKIGDISVVDAGYCAELLVAEKVEIYEEPLENSSNRMVGSDRNKNSKPRYK